MAEGIVYERIRAIILTVYDTQDGRSLEAVIAVPTLQSALYRPILPIVSMKLS
jgi:hypothetical protein